jgi:hypothetical protein
MTHDSGKETFGIFSGKSISVGVTDAAGYDLQQDLALFRAFDFDLLDD